MNSGEDFQIDPGKLFCRSSPWKPFSFQKPFHSSQEILWFAFPLASFKASWLQILSRVTISEQIIHIRVVDLQGGPWPSGRWPPRWSMAVWMLTPKVVHGRLDVNFGGSSRMEPFEVNSRSDKEEDMTALRKWWFIFYRLNKNILTNSSVRSDFNGNLLIKDFNEYLSIKDFKWRSLKKTLHVSQKNEQLPILETNKKIDSL